MPIDFKSLPVYQHRQEILDALESNQVIIIESPTGSGKTTQLPLILREAGYDRKGIIGITQPRRIATLSICDFIKRQIGDEGSYVGYTMRFADTSSHETRIKIMTDGILLQEVKADPMLSRYSVIMVDEAHERSLNIDFILGLLKEIIQKRTDLKVVVSSATINTKTFSDFFFSAPIISIDAKTYDVDVRYKSMVLDRDNEDLYYQGIEHLIAEDKKDNPGDVLIFLPGEAEIKGMVNTLSTSPNSSSYQIYPLYGRLSKEDQEKVFTPTRKGRTKIVVATNIAETSITIDGITTVIDSGNCKINFYNQKNFTSALLPMMISKSSADQRKGRAGRTREGVCYRLYTKDNYENRPEFTEEEILHSDLAEVVLRMSELGIYNYSSFPFITPPKKSALESAVETLRLINAINEDHSLTNIGQMMIRFPLLPRLSRVIVEAIMNYPEVLDEVVIAVSTLSTKQPYAMPLGEEYQAREAHKAFQNPKYGDFISMRTMFLSYKSLSDRKQKEEFARKFYLDIQTLDEIQNIHDQLEQLISQDGIPITSGGSVDEYFCCLISGLRQYVARKMDRRTYKTITADSIFIHPGSAWFKVLPEYILAGEIVQTTKMYARTVSPVAKQWLDQVDPMLAQQLKESRKRDKEEKKKAALSGNTVKKVAEGGFDSELDKLPVLEKGKKKTVYEVTVKEMNSLRTRDSKVRLAIRIGNSRSRTTIKASRIDFEAKLIRDVPVMRNKKLASNLDPYSQMDRILSSLGLLFTPISSSKGFFDFIGLCEHDGVFSLRPYASVQDAADESLESLYMLSETMGRKDKDKKKTVFRHIRVIEEALGLD